MADNPPVPFHLSPAASIMGVIDYSTPEGRKHFEHSIERLNDELFDCEGGDLHLFIDALMERAREMGWSAPGVGVTDILLDPLDPNSDCVNLLTHHGQLTLEQIRAFDRTYISSGTRAAQDNYAMHRCIRNSVKKNTLQRIGVWSEDHHIAGNASGNCLFKVVVRESGLDTKTTTSFIRQSLTSLDKHMSSIGDDVLKFNTHVKGLIRSLQERGEQTYDLLMHLKKGCMACKDKAFVKYIGELLERDEDHLASMLAPDLFMTRAANKCKSLVQNGQWQQPDAIERELMTLRAEVKESTSSASSKKSSNKTGSQRKENNNSKSRRYSIDRKTWSNRPAWLKNHACPDNVNHARTYGGVTFWYCCKANGGHCNGHWVKHRPSLCTQAQHGKRAAGQDKSKKETSDSALPNQEKQKTKRVKHVAQPMVIPSPDDDSDPDA